MESFENQHDLAKPMSVKDWLITLLIMAIPLVGFVMLFVYAFSSSGNVNRKNWAKANLIMLAIVLSLVFIVFLIFGANIMSAAAEADQY